MIPRLLIALNQNGAAMPSRETMTPAKAGPTARLTLMPTVRRHRGRKVLFGDELWHHRLPRRSRQRATRTDEKREQQKIAGRHQAEPDDRCEYDGDSGIHDLGGDEKFPSVDDVRKRASRQRE